MQYSFHGRKLAHTANTARHSGITDSVAEDGYSLADRFSSGLGSSREERRAVYGEAVRDMAAAAKDSWTQYLEARARRREPEAERER